MRKNIQKVIEAWRRGYEATGDSRRTCWTDGGSIYSYKTCLLTEFGGSLILNVTSYSPTTSQQQSAIRQMLADRISRIIEVDDIPQGSSNHTLIVKAGFRP